MAEKIDMRIREAAIVRFIKENGPDSVTVRETWEALRDEEHLGDHISIQAYHRIMNKMVARGKLIEVGADGAESRRFAVASYLTPENSLSLTDIEEGLWMLSAPEALARYLDALDYFEGRQKDVLERVATALLDEDPVELVIEMLRDKLDRLFESLSDYADPETRDGSVEKEISMRHGELVTLAHSYYGLSACVLDLGDADKVKSQQHVIQPNWEQVRAAIQERVFGERTLYYTEVDQASESMEYQGFSVGGSDGSTHAGYVHVVPGAEFIEDAGQLVLTFNNSLARICLPESLASGFGFPYHGVPMTRAALEDPSNRGMILARPWYPNLTSSEYEHMKKSALDVVQFRVDERILLGTARALGTDRTKGSGKLLPRPQVHFRDGTVVPQEREFNHYCRRDEYGEMVREGIALSYSILRTVKDSNHLVFAGAVKSTQLRTFSSLLNWYIARGSARKFGTPIDPQWDMSRAGYISDNHAMTRLLTAVKPIEPKKCLCSFAVLRPFPQLITTLFREKISDKEWIEHFEDSRDREIKRQQRWGGPDHYMASADIPDDPYVRMCREADYVMFYIGHSGGDPTPVLPRYEFLDSLRGQPLPDMRRKVADKVRLIIRAVSLSGLSLDSEHNFMTNKRVTRIIPAVVYDAHEKCKVWGHKLESELKSAITARLAELRRLRGVTATGLTLIPIQIREYLQRMQRTLQQTSEEEPPQLPEGTGETTEDRNDA